MRMFQNATFFQNLVNIVKKQLFIQKLNLAAGKSRMVQFSTKGNPVVFMS